MTQHILISNSSETQGRVLRYMLRAKGFEVTLTQNFWRGLQILEDRQADLIILDKHAPESCPKNMCEKCLHYCPGIPILMSGLDWCPAETSELLHYGVYDVISGPLETESLLAHVNTALIFSRNKKIA